MCNTAVQQHNQQQPNGFSHSLTTFAFAPFHLLRATHQQTPPLTETTINNDLRKKCTKQANTHGIAQILNEYDSSIATTLNSSATPTSQSPILDVTESTNHFALIENTNSEQQYLNSSTTLKLHHKSPTDLSENLKSIFSTHNGATAYKNFPSNPVPLSLLNSTVLPLSSSNNGSGKLATLPAFEYIAPANNMDNLNTLDFTLMELNRVGIMPPFMHRRQRGEKRPIPDEQKDEKYYERRKRNNEAAKKSRDARKIREDRIAFRAALLEQENSILRAQVMALRDELQTVRQLMNTNMGRAVLSAGTSAATKAQFL